MAKEKDVVMEEVVGLLKGEFDELPGWVIRLVVMYQFRYVSERIVEGEKLPIRLEGLGVFWVKRLLRNHPEYLALLRNRREDFYWDRNVSYRRRKYKYDKAYRERESREFTGSWMGGGFDGSGEAGVGGDVEFSCGREADLL